MNNLHATDHLQWKALAACRDEDPNTFFPTIAHKSRTVIARFCNNCPVKIECDQFATEQNITSGIWGGRVRS